ncbi:MAG: glycosyltransferase family 4 protein [Ilumatobacteraceae bacterium]
MGTPPQQASRTPVLLVNTPTLAPMGADTWIHVEIIRALDRSRFDVHVACSAGPPGTPTPMYAAIADLPNTEILCVNFGRERSGDIGVRRFSEVMKDLPAIVSFFKVAVHIRRERIPIIHTVSRPRDALACVLLGRITRTKCLIHMHVAFGEWMSRSLRWSVRHADGLVAISQFVRDSLVSGGVPSERIFLAHNGIVFKDWTPAADRSEVRRELQIPMSGPLVVSVSRLFRNKGTAELVRAIAVVRNEIPDVKLVVIGRDTSGGTYLSELHKIVEDEGLQDNVTFVGQRSDVPRFMAAADVFAMPSFEEPFGIVFAEAMAMQLPVVALNNGGTPEVVTNGSAGLLSEPGDDKTLAENLLTLLRDPDLRQQVGTYGRERVKNHFTVEHMARALEAIYETMADPTLEPPRHSRH